MHSHLDSLITERDRGLELRTPGDSPILDVGQRTAPGLVSPPPPGEANGRRSFALTEIVQQHAVWPRGDYDDAALARYRECPDQLPPIRVDRRTRVLLDGVHRLKVHQECGRAEIPVIF